MVDVRWQRHLSQETVPEWPVGDDRVSAAIVSRLMGVLEPLQSFEEGDRQLFGAMPHEVALQRIHELAAFQRVLFKEWTVELCYLLSQFEILRFSQLQRKMSGISTRTLACRLSALQQLGFIRRRLLQTIPPHVEYRLTPQGSTFVRLVRPLLHWLQSIRSAITPAAPTASGGGLIQSPEPDTPPEK